MEVVALDPDQIHRFLDRRRRTGNAMEGPVGGEIHFDELFCEILRTANEFVPSEAGSIMLDDPRSKRKNVRSTQLVFVACFGPKSENLLGKTLTADQGVAGKTYRSAQPYRTTPDDEPTPLYRKIDEEIGYRTESIASVPIIIEKSVCGVLQVLNKKDGKPYTERELELLKIFAGYISTSLQNALEAKRSAELSKRDDLTGLYNDRFFNFKLSQDILNIGSDFHDLSLIFLDLDHFKQVNDTHGHLAGSRTLSELGPLLRRVVRKKEATLARYGGDEFVIILPGSGVKTAQETAEKIRKAVKAHVFIKTRGDGGEPALNIKNLITCSIGVASFRDHLPAAAGLKEMQNQLIYLADQAMYRAKENGRNRVELAES